MTQTGEKGTDTPTPEDFSKRSIKRAVFSEAIQHPTTLFSAAIALLSGLYMGLVSFDETSFAIGLGSGLFSLLSWVYHYFVRGETVAENYVRDLREKRKKYKEEQVQNIEEKCREAGFIEGEKAAKELKQAYTRLNRFLREKFKKKKTMSAQRFMILAEESYDQGMQFLNKALSLFRALDQIDEKKLNKELKVWEKEVNNLEKDGKKEEEHKSLIIKALREKIRSHRRRLELFVERSKTLKQVMAQCEILEATLDSTYLEVVDLIDGESYMKQDNVAGKLERAVSAARKVEDRLRGLGKEKSYDDSIYTNVPQKNGVME